MFWNTPQQIAHKIVNHRIKHDNSQQVSRTVGLKPEAPAKQSLKRKFDVAHFREAPEFT